MLYSVIIPVFNRKKYIWRCINSVVRQSIKDFELIIVDDGSYDGTEEICNQFEQRYENVRVIHQKNGGVSKARNTGIKAAKGEIVLFVDSDDYLPNDYLYQFSLAYKKYGMDFLYCASFKIYTVSGIRYFCYRKSTDYSILKADGLVDLMNKMLFNSVVNKVYEMSLIKEYNLEFPEDVSLGEDLIFNLRYLDKKGEFKFIVLNKNFYVGSWKNTKGSLERSWREDYSEIQRMLLKEKEKYIKKWFLEKKLHGDREKILNEWYCFYMNDCVIYYLSNMRNIGFIQLIRKLKKLMLSPEYDTYVRICGGRRWIMVPMVFNILRSRIKEIILNQKVVK